MTDNIIYTLVMVGFLGWLGVLIYKLLSDRKKYVTGSF